MTTASVYDVIDLSPVLIGGVTGERGRSGGEWRIGALIRDRKRDQFVSEWVEKGEDREKSAVAVNLAHIYANVEDYVKDVCNGIRERK